MMEKKLVIFPKGLKEDTMNSLLHLWDKRPLNHGY